MKRFLVVALVSCCSVPLFSADRFRSKSLPNPEEINKIKYNCWVNFCYNISAINQNIQVEKQCAHQLDAYIGLKQRISQEKDRSNRDRLWNEANDVLDSMNRKAENILKKEIFQSSAIHFPSINPIK